MSKSPIKLGDKYGRLTVVGMNRTGPRLRVQCRCDCGTTKTVYSFHLTRKGHKTVSCGCRKVEHLDSLEPWTIHGHCSTTISPTYKSWSAMMSRCLRPKHRAYKKYAKFFYEPWRDFRVFLKDMGERPSRKFTIERIDNKQGYSPSNCRWATRKEQCRNTQRNRVVKYRGESLPLCVWSERMGIRAGTIKERLNRKWTIRDALERPTMKGGAH